MIGSIRGKLIATKEDYVIIESCGVGYKIYCSNKTLSTLDSSSEIFLLIETEVREDSISLYGFCDEEEKKWFLHLRKIKGVGAKVTLKILSHCSSADLLIAVSAKDKSIFSPVAGIGPKLALRIITELQGKIKNIDFEKDKFTPKNTSLGTNDKIEFENKNSIFRDAVMALESLGYSKSNSYKTVSLILQNSDNITLENLITKSLQNINREN